MLSICLMDSTPFSIVFCPLFTYGGQSDNDGCSLSNLNGLVTYFHQNEALDAYFSFPLCRNAIFKTVEENEL